MPKSLRLLTHRIRSRKADGNGIHSPFLYRFITVVLDHRHPFYPFEELALLEDMTGSKARANRLSNQLLFRIAHDQRPTSAVLMGDGADTSARYLQKACPGTHLHCSEKQEFSPSELEAFLRENAPIDLLLFSQVRTWEESWAAWLSCRASTQAHSVVALRNPHQDRDTRAFWKALRHDARVSVSLDLGELGLLFFRQELPQKHLRLRIKHPHP